MSNSLFGLSGINRFNDLLVFLRADNRLIPQNYEKRLKKGNKYVVLENGVLDLQTLKLRPHSADYLTFYELDVKWKQEIHAPHFKKYLESVSGGEIIKRIVEVFGYLLSPVNEGKCFFVMGMAPDSGKSTLGNLLQRLLGEEYVISRTAHILGDRFALGDLPGKILSLSMDLPRGRLKPEAVSILKQVTGGDTVMTEQKYEIAQNIHSNVRFLFGSNFSITISNEDNDDSFWNRMVIVPFLYSVPRKDMDMELLEKLLEEKDAIVSMCLRAMHDVIERNYRFSDCKAADEMKAQWRYSTEGSTLLKEFADEMIEVTGRKEDEVSVKALYGIYIEYCQRCREAPVTQYKMIEWMDSHLNGCERKRVHHTGMNPTSAYVGVRWAHGSVKSR